MCTWRPSMRLSRTLMPAKSSMFWNDRATPSFATRYGASPVMSRPSRVIRPRWGRYSPETAFRSEVFPAPFGPMMAKISPRSTSMETPASATTPPNRKCRSAALNWALIPRASIDAGVREYADTVRRRRDRVPCRLDLLPVLDRARERRRSASDRVAQARRIQSRPRGHTATWDRRRRARRREGLRRRRHRADARATARDAAPLRPRRDRGADVAGLSSVRRWPRERHRLGLSARGGLDRLSDRMDPGRRRGRASDQRAAPTETAPAPRQPSLVCRLPRGHLGTGGRDADGARRARGARACHCAPSDGGLARGPRDRRSASAGYRESCALRPQRITGARARGDHVTSAVSR